MQEEAIKLLELGLVTISCNKKKIPCIKGWTEITKANCIENIKDNQNIGILTGEKSGITVIDIDIKDNGVEVWNKLIEKHDDIKTPKVQTGTGGFHYYFKYNDKFLSDSKIVKMKDYKLVGIDVKNNGGYVVAPPSVNNEGKKYEWLNNFTKYELQDIPNWFLEYVKNKKTKENKKEKPIKKNNNLSKKNDNNENKEETNVESEQISTQTELPVEIIREILFGYKKERCNIYDDWTKVGMALKNINNDYYYLFNEWSAQSTKYNESECKKKWQSFKANGELQISSLFYWLKEDNKTLFTEIVQKIKHNNIIKTTIMDNKDRFALNEYKIDNYEIDNIIRDANFTYVMLDNVQCPFVGKYDKDHNIYIEINMQEMYIRCSKCIGKRHPKPAITVQNNFYINYNNSESGILSSIDVDILDDNIKIFENKTLNNLLLYGLAGSEYDLVKLIAVLSENRFCYGKDDMWYSFTNHSWNANNMEIDTHIRNFVFKLKQSTYKKNIFNQLKIYYNQNNKDFVDLLDTNPYLIGFKNGIYDLKKN